MREGVSAQEKQFTNKIPVICGPVKEQNEFTNKVALFFFYYYEDT